MGGAKAAAMGHELSGGRDEVSFAAPALVALDATDGKFHIICPAGRFFSELKQ